jgi:sorbitol/mannitol transport system substrate-binding protein
MSKPYSRYELTLVVKEAFVVRNRMSGRSRFLRRGVALTAIVTMAATGAVFSSGATSAQPKQAKAASVTIRVAVVSTPQVTEVEQLLPDFYKMHPNIKVAIDTLPEDTERAIIETDIATQANEFNAVMISNYETPMWAKNHWLVDLSKNFTASDPGYDVSDLIKPIAQSLMSGGELYGVPFTGESSFVMYNKSMLKAAGLTMPLHPTWTQIATMAAKLNNPSKGVSGICLRGEAGWGENLAPLDTVINTFGGSWFNMKWVPQLTSPADEQAVNFYVKLLRTYGEPGAAADGVNECLQYYDSKKTALWYDSTAVAPEIAVDAPSVYADTGYAFAPTGPSGRASGWQYVWSFSIASGTPNQKATWDFISWMTSKQLISEAAQKFGWAAVPGGNRTSTYVNPKYQKVATYAPITLASMEAARPDDPTVHPVPYTGIQFVAIPEFINLGNEVSQQISAAIAGRESVATALSISQQDALTSVSENGL